MSNTISKRLKVALIRMIENEALTPRQRLDASRQLIAIEKDKLPIKRRVKAAKDSQSSSVLGTK